MFRRLVAAFALAALFSMVGAVGSEASIKATHAGWPTFDGGLFINRLHQSRPMDMRAGHDPFDGSDPSYSCDGLHHNQQCLIDAGACAPSLTKTRMCAGPPVMPENNGRHHELLGGRGSDTIYGADGGDVIWADYTYPPQPLTQHDKIVGGAAKDFIYGSHGYNEIHTGGGADLVNVRYGRGVIFCDSSTARVNFSRRSRRRFTVHGCKHITMKAIGTFEDSN